MSRPVRVPEYSATGLQSETISSAPSHFAISSALPTVAERASNCTSGPPCLILDSRISRVGPLLGS